MICTWPFLCRQCSRFGVRLLYLPRSHLSGQPNKLDEEYKSRVGENISIPSLFLFS
jgi:hypothetical protein